MNEKQIEKHFNKIVKKFHRELGHKGGTSNHELDRLGKKVFGKQWITTSTQMHLPIRKIRKMKRGYGIFNTDSHGEGIHWVAVCVNNDQFYIWDSFGRPSKEIVADLTARLKNQRVRYQANDLDRNQKNAEEDCGQRCMAFLECCKTLGVQKAMKI
jgi:hypothetical protein